MRDDDRFDVACRGWFVKRTRVVRVLFVRLYSVCSVILLIMISGMY